MRTTMIRPALAVLSLAVMAAVGLAMSSRSDAEPVAVVAAAPLAHMVFFSLADRSEENAKKLTDACHQYLDNHDGVVYFSVGTRVEDLDREVNATDFDVALHVVFDSRESHDAYQVHPRHLEFIEKNKDLWGGVRVYDSTLGSSSSR